MCEYFRLLYHLGWSKCYTIFDDVITYFAEGLDRAGVCEVREVCEVQVRCVLCEGDVCSVSDMYVVRRRCMWCEGDVCGVREMCVV